VPEPPRVAIESRSAGPSPTVVGIAVVLATGLLIVAVSLGLTGWAPYPAGSDHRVIAKTDTCQQSTLTANDRQWVPRDNSPRSWPTDVGTPVPGVLHIDTPVEATFTADQGGSVRFWPLARDKFYSHTCDKP
jgi:hypothetical protein